MFGTRLLSSIILMIVTISVIILGGNVLFAVLLVISFIGMMELYKIVGIHKSLPGIIGYVACAVQYLLLFVQHQEYQMQLFIVFLIILLLSYVFLFPKFNTDQITLVFFGLFYVGVMLSYIYQVRMLEDGAWLVWLIFIGAWGSDTCAYCIGILFGKHKVAPKLSPKKSLEGCIAGVVGAALIGFIFATIIQNYITVMENTAISFAIIGAASSVISQIGDLAASAIKRNHNIKDYGNLIPGHGGILDRFDSILFTAPIVYYLAVFTIK